MGIGTSSPTELLEVFSAGATAAIEVSAGTASTTTGEAKIVLRSLHSASGTTYSRSEIASVGVAGGDSDLIFRTTSDSSGPQPRMTITDAGDVLVSNTVTNPVSNFSNQKGLGYTASTGQLQIASTTNNAQIEVGRNSSSDGNWMTFRKQSNVLGNLGTYGGTLYIGSANGGIMFNGTAIEPTTGAATRADNIVDLGSSVHRFNDVFVAGGVNFSDANGGQNFSAGNAANTLSDYEEGVHGTSWTCGTSGTITLNGAYNNMQYTKIGRVVICTGYFLVSSVSSPAGRLQISLPFPAKNTASNSSSVFVAMNVLTLGNVADAWGIIDSNSSTANIYFGAGTSVSGNMAGACRASTDMRFQATYLTDA